MTVGKFEIRTWYDGRTHNQFRKVAEVEAPTALHALRAYAGNRQAIIRQRKTDYSDAKDWTATILNKNGKLRDYIAVRVRN
jgi:hypothetical protein